MTADTLSSATKVAKLALLTVVIKPSMDGLQR